MDTQKKTIEVHLKLFCTISSWEAITKYRITRLSQMIYLLKNDGLNITDSWQYGEDGKKHWKVYKYEAPV